MIVEDELIVAKNIERQLQKIGYDVIATAVSGEEALAKVEECLPHIVLMDIHLSSSMDGVQTAEQIRRQHNIPVVYLTAYADNETVQRAKFTDPFGYVLKPFEPSKLHSTIEIALYKHQMERKLQESELRFRTLATSAPVGIFQTDIDGHCIFVNTQWSEITGLSMAEAAGEGWVQALAPQDSVAISEAWYTMARTNGTFSREYRFRAYSGKITWVYGHAAPLRDDLGNVTGYIGTITDITDRKAIEDAMLTGKKLESIGILAGGIAHDFNNLLSVITGNISMLKSDNNITPDQFHMLNNMEKASTQAAELAHKLITFSKGGWINRKSLQLPHLLDQVIRGQFPNLKNYAAFKIDIPADILPVEGDDTQLKQVFFNLIINAVEAVENSHTKEISLFAQNIPKPDPAIPLPDKPYIKVTLLDSGTGILPEHLGKIFDPYFTTKSMGSQKGLGLGLAICYSIIKKHGGHIQVISPPSHGQNQGTQIELYLPAFTEPKVTQAPVENTVTKKSPRILVLDDDPIIQDVLSQMLKRLGYHVEAFDNGQLAVEAYKKAMTCDEPFEILLLDLINKKGLGGFETLQQLLQLDPTVSGKAIAISGFSDQSDLESLKNQGFSDILTKPFKWKDLQQMLEKYFQNPQSMVS